MLSTTQRKKSMDGWMDGFNNNGLILSSYYSLVAPKTLPDSMEHQFEARFRVESERCA